MQMRLDVMLVKKLTYFSFCAVPNWWCFGQLGDGIRKFYCPHRGWIRWHLINLSALTQYLTKNVIVLNWKIGQFEW